MVEILEHQLTFEEAAGVWPIIHPDDAARVRAAIDSTQGKLDEARAEWRVRLPSGEYRWIEARALPRLGADGQVGKLVGVVLDIDARKRQELALLEAQQAAEAATEAKSQFLANMSHEIRTPMNGVLGVLHLLEQEPLSQEGKALLEEAQGCGQMLAQLLNDVIDFSRIEAGRLELSPEPLDIADMLHSVVGMLRPQAAAKGLELRTSVAGEGVRVMADPVRLRQALFNLIGNAVKFTNVGHVEVRLRLSGDEAGAKRIRFEVEDTGVGIPAEAQERLFQRFHQADGSTARRFGGSGLGLAITRSLADMMGGEVGFVSQEGQGSTFWFDVPAPAAPSAGQAVGLQARSDGAPLGGMRILVVEDNPTNRLVAGKILESLGASVATAEDGALGVEAAAAGGYDVVLMDVQMPRVDGVEATRRIRALAGEAAATPIIGLTANVLAHQRSTYLAAGMNGVASKPISPGALLEEIARVLAEAPAGAVSAAY
jgi:signal transduction histidine kinase/CheY-like chemotaxis protein